MGKTRLSSKTLNYIYLSLCIVASVSIIIEGFQNPTGIPHGTLYNAAYAAIMCHNSTAPIMQNCAPEPVVEVVQANCKITIVGCGINGWCQYIQNEIDNFSPKVIYEEAVC